MSFDALIALLAQWGAVLFRIAWALLAAVGVVRSKLNWDLVHTARAKLAAAQLNGIQSTRAHFYRRDILLLCAALTCSGLAALAALFMLGWVALSLLCAEHILLVWLAFNFSAGWSAVSHKILEERLRQSALSKGAAALPMTTEPALKDQEG